MTIDLPAPVRARVSAWVCALALAACGSPAQPPSPGQPAERSAPRAAPASTSPSAPSSIPPETAYLVVETPSGRELRSAHAERLDAPVLPGSIAKIAVLAAALDTGVVTAQTGLACRRSFSIDGHQLTCVHPDLHRPLTAAEALAHSCNSWFASVAERVPRPALNARRVALGLAPLGDGDPLVLSALGLAGPASTPRTLGRLLPRLVDERSTGLFKPETRAVLLDGLRGAVSYGTASDLRDVGEGLIAKTGTAPMPGGGYVGLLVAFRPAAPGGSGPESGVSAVVLAPGGSGRDAATIAAVLLRDITQSARRTVRVGEARGDRYEVVERPLEDYAARAVSGEAGPAAPPAAREAIAIAARTFALANRNRHRDEGFDVCDLTHCLALREPDGPSRDAARATEGRYLVYQAAPAQVWLTASCGGRTAAPGEIWPGPDAEAPYLVSRAEPQCRMPSHWHAEIVARDLARALAASGLRGRTIEDVRVVARTPSGRVARLRITGFEPREISAEAFRLAVGRTLGWNLIRSHIFEISRTAAGYAFDGFGFGHGVGLCVAGAARLADTGRSAEEILATYFPGTSVATVAAAPASTAVRLELPESDKGERASLQALLDRSMNDLRVQTGVEAPEGLRVRFHPTVESFRRSTGRPWWVAAATQDGRIELLPVGVLRRRGTLTSTVRHELAHAFVDRYLQGRPLWAREGAAMYFAGEAGTPADATCPSDQDMLSAASAEAMRAVYDRAAACFAREMARGRTWRQVGTAGL